MRTPMTKSQAKKRFGDTFWDSTASRLCWNCANSVFFLGNEPEEDFACPHCNENN
jgi:hypothetical protein